MSSEWRTLWHDVLSNSSGNLPKCNTRWDLDTYGIRGTRHCGIRILLPSCRDNTSDTLVIECQSHRCRIARMWTSSRPGGAQAEHSDVSGTYMSCSSCITIRSIMWGMCAGTFRDVNPNLLFRILFTYRRESANVSFSCLPVCLLSVK